ncbi:MAG: PGF-CTERM sorting domain-containing protein [Haloferacaceae archaeon]
MERESALAVGAAGVTVLALMVAVLVPGAVADPTERGPVRPGPVDISEVAISPADVSGGHVVLTVETRLSHSGNPTRNVSVRVRAVDAESGLVETTETVAVGDLTEEREVPVTTNLTVAREGGYRIETVVYRDGERVASGSKTIRGLEALKPPYARSSVRFTDSEALPPVSFSVERAGEERTTLALAATLTNTGGDVADDLRVTFVLRQADSNIVANRTSAQVGRIRPGRTATAESTVTVPAGYNYYVDAVLWKGDVVVDTARAAANLDPTERISVNETERDVELQVSDFERGDGGGGRPVPTETDGVSGSGAPGFGVGVALVAVLAAALVARRWSA